MSVFPSHHDSVCTTHGWFLIWCEGRSILACKRPSCNVTIYLNSLRESPDDRASLAHNAEKHDVF